MAKEIKRGIKKEVERSLWARAAGRCEFKGCNRLLCKSPITQEEVNIAEKAHIYSISERGPRGWGPLSKGKDKINQLENLMLVCPDCHKTIDQDKEGERYSAELLLEWKRAHEERIEIATGILPENKSHVVLYGANIGEQRPILNPKSAKAAMFPYWYPSSKNPINLSMLCSHDDSTDDYWKTESKHLYTLFIRYIKPIIEESDSCHFSLFSLAPQPLLILLGTLFTDIIPVEVYQPHREPQTWKWASSPEQLDLLIKEPVNFKNDPVLIISLSDRISPDRVKKVIGENISIWELTSGTYHNNILKSRAQLSSFREAARLLLSSVKECHGIETPLKIFPAMPVACAVELGRVRMPKTHMPFIIYDQNNKAGKFIETIKIPGDLNE